MRTIFLFTLSIAVLCLGFRIEAQKLSADEIIAKHIQAVGGKEKLGSIKNRIAAGLSEFESKLPSKRTGGKAVIVGQGQDLMFVASFASNEYPFEKIGYFSGKQSLPFVPTGARSPLGAFLAEHPAILREGLFAGVIVRNWAVFDAKSESSKFRPGGTKKIGNRECFVVDYFPDQGGSSSFTIRLFFDKESFNHVRTEYRHVIPPQSVPSGILGTQSGVEQKMTEEFDDFRAEEGVMLPHKYKINYLSSSNSGTYEFVWGVNISGYVFNKNLAADFFTFDENK